MRKSKKIKPIVESGGIKAPGLDEFVIECKYTNKKSIKITQEFLVKLYDQAKDSNKKPYLIIGIPKNNEEIFILRCFINIERKDK